MVRIDEQGQIMDFCSEDDVKKLEGMVRFQLLYQKIFKEGKALGAYAEEKQNSVEDLKNQFANMLRYLQAAGGAIDGEIIVPYKNRKEQVEKYIALELGVSSEIQCMENKERNILEFMRENTNFEGDTYAVCDRDREQKWILLKFYDEISSRNDNIPTIYMLFPYGGAYEGEILHALKNILIFRNKIWKILNLSSSTLLHSMIGYMNSQVLGDKGKFFMSVSDMNFHQFWKGDEKCFDAASAIWKLNIEFR